MKSRRRTWRRIALAAAAATVLVVTGALWVSDPARAGEVHLDVYSDPVP